jgi:hypothetical protein
MPRDSGPGRVVAGDPGLVYLVMTDPDLRA